MIDRVVSLMTCIFLGILAFCSFVALQRQQEDIVALKVELEFKKAQVGFYTSAIYGSPNDTDTAFRQVELTYQEYKKFVKGEKR